MTASKTTRRRRSKKSRFLNATARDSQRTLRFEWDKRIVSWLSEINRRGAALRASEAPDIACGQVFEVVEMAESVLASCDTAVVELVGDETRDVLISECCKVVARIYGAELYKVINHRYPKSKV